MSITSTTWTPASEPPAVEPGHRCSVIVAWHSIGGTWHVFGAWYLQQYELNDSFERGDDDDDSWTGFYTCKSTDEYDDPYEPVAVEFWAPMPEPPRI